MGKKKIQSHDMTSKNAHFLKKKERKRAIVKRETIMKKKTALKFMTSLNGNTEHPQSWFVCVFLFNIAMQNYKETWLLSGKAGALSVPDIYFAFSTVYFLGNMTSNV